MEAAQMRRIAIVVVGMVAGGCTIGLTRPGAEDPAVTQGKRNQQAIVEMKDAQQQISGQIYRLSEMMTQVVAAMANNDRVNRELAKALLEFANAERARREIERLRDGREIERDNREIERDRRRNAP